MRKLRFAIFGNIFQAKKSVLTKALLCALEEHGAEIIIDRLFYDYLVNQLMLDVHPAELIEGNQFQADIAVSMGGDGTFLQTAARVAEKQIPIVGINTGRLGFLADVGADEITRAIETIYNDDYFVEERSALQLSTSAGANLNDPFALNEVAVMKRDSSSMISIRVDVNGEYLGTYQADGLIVNTPTGSTGYALSVGGPIMMPESHTLGLVPVAPHSLNVRPITLSDNAEVTLTVESRNHNFLVAIDGRNHACHEDIRLTIRRADHVVKILRRNDNSFFRTLRTKLMWGSDIRIEG